VERTAAEERNDGRRSTGQYLHRVRDVTTFSGSHVPSTRRDCYDASSEVDLQVGLHARCRDGGKRKPAGNGGG
jgi:hypothetical protein